MICVVGALAVDVLVSRERFLKKTSNPSSIRFSAGGVGYRIYSHLQGQKCLFTALGSDAFGRWLMAEIDHPQWVNPIFLEEYPTSCYCAFMQSGELLYAAADMAVVEQGLSWAHLRSRLPELGPGDFLVLEANLSPSLVSSLLRQAGKRTRVVFESVSVQKLLRHADRLRDLYLLAANQDELRALAGRLGAEAEHPEAEAAGRCADQAKSAGSEAGRAGGQPTRSASDAWLKDFLLNRNIEHLLLSRGRRGLRLYRKPGAPEDTSPWRLDIAPGRVVSAADTTGAGDTLLAAFLEALDQAPGPEAALRAALQIVERAIEEGKL